MNTRFVVALGLIATLASAQASACAFTAMGTASSSAQADAFAQFAGGIKDAQQGRVGSAQGLPGAGFTGTARGSIVGLWKFAFTAPDGVSSIDWGFQTWHDDGTELTNSGGRPPDSGNFCMGAWEQRGGGAYSLNHWAIAWGLPPDFDSSAITGLVNIRELVSVDRSGNSMSGTVSLDLYALDGTTLMAHLVDGTVSGARISP